MQHHSPGAVEARHGGQDVDVLHAGAVHLGHAQGSTWCRGGAGRAGGDRLSEEEEKEKRKHFSTSAGTTRPGIFSARLRYEKGQRFFYFYICPPFFTVALHFASEQELKTKQKELFAQRRSVVLFLLLHCAASPPFSRFGFLPLFFCHFVSSLFTHAALAPRLFP